VANHEATTPAALLPHPSRQSGRFHKKEEKENQRKEIFPNLKIKGGKKIMIIINKLDSIDSILLGHKGFDRLRAASDGN